MSVRIGFVWVLWILLMVNRFKVSVSRGESGSRELMLDL